jgi:hypothetical protein
MTPQQKFVRLAGQYLYGDKFRTPLAYALDVNVTTVRDWVLGKKDVSEGVINDILLLVQERQKEYDELQKSIASLPELQA